jgi:hypothetical protein
MLGEVVGCAGFRYAAGGLADERGRPGRDAQLAGLAWIARDLARAVFTLRQCADWQPGLRLSAVCVLPAPARPGRNGVGGVVAAWAARDLLALGDDREETWPGTRQLINDAPAYRLRGLAHDLRPSGPGDGCRMTGPLYVEREVRR